MHRYGIAAAFAWAAVLAGIAGAVISRSLAVLGDAIHGLVDAAGITMAAVVHSLVARGATSTYTYGLHRAETLAAMFNSATLIAGSAYIVAEAINKLVSGVDVDPLLMAISSVIVLALNIVAVLLLHGGTTLNIRAAYLHALSDLGVTLAALGGAIAIMLTGVRYLDVVIALAISAYLVKMGIPILRTSIGIALDKSPVDVERLRDELGLRVHDFHVWALCPDIKVASLHVVVEDPDMPMSKLEDLRRYISEKLERHGICHVTVQFELGKCVAEHSHEEEHGH